MSLIFEIAWRHVTTRLRQTSVAIFGVAIGVAFTMMIIAMLVGRQIDFVAVLVDSMPHVTLRDEKHAVQGQPAERKFAAVQTSNLIAAEKGTGIKNPNEVMASLNSWLPGAIAPSVKTTVVIHDAKEQIGVTLTGIDPRRELTVSKLETHMLGNGHVMDLQRGSNSILIGEGLAKKIAARVGSTVNLSTSGGALIPATVVGIFRSGIRDVDEKQIYSLIRTAQIIISQPGIINEIRIHLKEPRTADKIAKQVEFLTGYRAVSWQEANSDVLSTLKVTDIIMYIISGAMLLASTFGIYSIISTITNEKRHDIAIMKSFGMKEGVVRSIFIVESAIIGAVGVIVGFLLGYLLCMAVSQITFKNPFVGTVQHVAVYYTYYHLAVIGSIALVACVASAFLPARKATQVHPVDIIRGAA
jgi:lipoprotein-releasing system permease protein